MTDTAQAASGLGTADSRREQMLRAALEVIAERGYADTRIADVAERIGISPALVIYYFKTKDQLLTESIRYLDNIWYAVGQRRMAELPTAAARIEEIVAMSCLPEADAEPRSSWTLWLDGQQAGEVRVVDADNFAILLCSLLDGLAIQIALDDPVVGPERAFDLCMQFIAEQLGFEWKDSQRARNGGYQAGQSNGARQEGR